jgi:hypothetical protein
MHRKSTRHHRILSAEQDKRDKTEQAGIELARALEENHRLSGELVEAVARVAELTVALRSARSVPVDSSSIAGALTVLVNGRIELKDVSADTNPVNLIELAKDLTDIAVELQRARKAKAEK